MIGKTLGNFTLEVEIGKGGMGEVYKAKDQKLGRDVAIKVLPEEFAKDADRIARFQREAKLLASLNHPNIAAIHGLEESDGIHFLVLELIEGDTLADQIKKSPIPVEESLKLALQIAEALEAAHEKGVIHRDLKPSNIKVTPNGKVKVLDFGLAKAFAGDQGDANLSNSPTLSAAATQQGVILGTAAYMSPEQARGESVDKGADIWAFGVVLFEILAGRQVFAGKTVSDTLAAVLAKEPEWKGLPPNLHSRIRLLLERCLKKEPKNRYHDIADARVDIQEALADPSGVFVRPVTGTASRARLKQMFPWITAAVIVTVIITGISVWYLKPLEPRQVIRFEYDIPENQQLINTSYYPLLSISSDGSKFVYSTNEGLYLRSMDGLDGRLISGTNDNSLHPFFSPDGRWVGYWSQREQQLKKIDISGGAPVTLCDTANPRNPMWNEDDTIVYIGANGIMQVSANGGTSELIVDSEGREFFDPQILPNGKSVLFAFIDGNEPKIAVQSLESGERKVLTEGFGGNYLTTGHLAFFLENNLLVVPFDLKTLSVEGGPVPMVSGIQWQGGTAAPQYAISDSGTLIYLPGGIEQSANRILALVDRKGHIDQLNASPKAYVSPRISPDGRKLVVQSIDADSGASLWVYDLTVESEIQQLTFEGNNYRPIWTPDSQRITFSSDRDGGMSLYWMPADGSGVADRLTSAEDGTSHWAESWSPDGEALAYVVERNIGTDYDICFTSPGCEPECRYDRPDTVYLGAQFSPDGKWFAYSSGPNAGLVDIYVEPFPPTGALRRITLGGGRGIWATWSPDGRELFYRPTTASGQMHALKAVDIATNPEFTFRNERMLPIKGFSTVSYYRGYDITPDGGKFLMTFPVDSAKSTERENRQINIVVNWFEELKERVPAP
jgi:serine/threonine-protein kinase